MHLFYGVFDDIVEGRNFILGTVIISMSKNYNEVEIINKIINFEENIFSEYKNKLLVYQEEIGELGIEIHSNITRWETPSLSAPSEPYNLKTENRLPGFHYSSQIYGLTHKNGQILAEQASYDRNVTCFFPLIFPLVSVSTTKVRRRIKEIYFYETTLNNFDKAVTLLLESVKKHLRP